MTLEDLSLPPEVIVIVRRDIRFALSILDECRCVGELANVMTSVIAGVASTAELDHKLRAFGSGIASLKGSPVPCAAHFEWADA